MEFLGGEEGSAEAEFDQVGAAATSLHGLLVVVLLSCCVLAVVGGGWGRQGKRERQSQAARC